ncbi:2,3-bisphosphoglycerate-independent phosphoglycerate mutase [Pajaroellobacter abortibovis]|uniref:2,3-bisphosphoglycerate-independent phosphoglycerate mutase n=1 Tax=Pajaroellobacter abortibovis TaxID=1882918 RepID=A0A1L6MZ35_9BACT|nr:2,3-bisphosphoglycerate-independent phosphoglycerate mutase [Pajaroellobacter abortibovis]APS00766.1 phosphoglycerate mutase (2,3-diphosphoglycerate-independent) [Pajaroellobacter abortibovis]
MNTPSQLLPPPPRPLLLLILDGFGERKERENNAVHLAHTPNLDSLFARYPSTLLGASGPDVGLPTGQIGNSEVGHLTIGAGRVMHTDICRIDQAITNGSFANSPVLQNLLHQAHNVHRELHIFGLVSDGKVHSALEHLFFLIERAASQAVAVVVHAFLDGRDVPPKSALKYIQALENKLEGKGRIGSISGRYYAMDRDHRWQRIHQAYQAIVHGQGMRFPTAIQGIKASYDTGKTDEFVEPFVVGTYQGVQAEGIGFHFNFRPDRARQLTEALAIQPFNRFPRTPLEHPPFPHYACMTTYDASFGLPIVFPKENPTDIFPEVIARHGLQQLRCAETEKYAHVTYFFNGGREKHFEREERILIPSPTGISTYDQQPAMSAPLIADAVIHAIESDRYDFILANFANPDMVGHTGILQAAIAAVESVDQAIGSIVNAAQAKNGAVIITSDHGNCELMLDAETGQPHTAHTLNPVPFLYIPIPTSHPLPPFRTGGKLCDIAPTLLTILGIEQPPIMTGLSLFVSS